MSYQCISSLEEFDSALKQSESEAVTVFKHSSTCDISIAAKKEVDNVKLPVYEVVVQTARSLSNHIESHFKIRHESPQVIVIYRGEPIFDASHRAVTAESIHAASDTLAT